MIRDFCGGLVKIDISFDWKKIFDEYVVLNERFGVSDHHQKNTDNLRGEKYHTGGWKEILLSNGRSFREDVINLCPYTKTVVNYFKSSYRRVKFSVLQSGHRINPHVGNTESSEYARLHIPIITNDQVIFHSGKKTVNMKLGELWYLNQVVIHSVENNSNVDRVHLIIDLDINDWVLDMISPRKLL